MNADEIFNAIFKYGYMQGVRSVLAYKKEIRQVTKQKLKAVEELKHLIAIRDDTDTAYPEKPLHNDKC